MKRPVATSGTRVVALVQRASVRYEKDANLAAVAEALESVGDEVDVALFPELFLTGYATFDRLPELAEPEDGPSMRRLSGLARDHGVVLVVGYVEEDGEVLHNSACVIDSDGTVLGSYRKTHLFDGEPAHFAPGDALPVFHTRAGRIGILICYDLEFPEAARILALQAAQLILVPTANMDPYQRHHDAYLRARAMENGLYVATANHIGDDGVYRYFGRSGLVDPEGRWVCETDDRETTLLGEVDLSAVPPSDVNLRYLGLRRPDLYARLVDLPDPEAGG